MQMPIVGRGDELAQPRASLVATWSLRGRPATAASAQDERHARG
jgi:hypothetical protein